MADYIAPAFLCTMWAWGVIDSKITSNLASQYKPAPLAATPTLTPEGDVSVVVYTLNPPPEFGSCLLAIYDNNPFEIIISTTKQHLQEVLHAINKVTSSNCLDRSKISLIISEKGARLQLSAGVIASRGRIIATCNDTVLWSPTYLTHMLATFEDPLVGAAGPPIKVHIPLDRRNSQVITPWEVAGTKLAHRSPTSAISMQVAAQWCWIIAGTTGVYRASILKDPSFLKAFNNDYWGNSRLDVGDDTFISRWLLRNGWVIAVQCKEETRVWRSVKRSRKFVGQMLRWERSTVQSFLRTTWEVRGVWRNFYVARKTIERILKSPLAILHLLAWITSFYTYPILTFFLLVYYIYKLIPGYQTFFKEFPYMKKYWWAAVAVDFSYVIIGPWAWLTLSDNTWERGEVGVEMKKKVVEK